VVGGSRNVKEWKMSDTVVVRADLVRRIALDSRVAEIKSLDKKIRDAAAKGHLSVVVDDISSVVEWHLGSQGFKVVADEEEGHLVISW